MRICSIAERLLALFLCSLLITNGACVAPLLDPRAGWAEFLEHSFIRVPGGWVNAGGGNLLVQRNDLSIDTLLGTQQITATYNAATGEWIWSFQMTYDGIRFTDASGFSQLVDGVPDGEAVAGTHWVKIDADTVQSKGGMAYEFDSRGRLASQHWATFDYPRVQYVYEDGELTIEQCTVENVCSAFFVLALQEDGNPTRVTDARTGRVCTYAYADGLLVNAQSAGEYAEPLPGTSYEYDGTLLVAITSSEGERVEYDYDSGRRITRVVQVGEGNPTHSFAHYSVDGNNGYLYRTVYTNPLGGKLRLFFDGARKLHEAHYLGTEDRRIVSWNEQRRVIRDRLRNGATTEFVYEGDAPVQVTEPSGNIVEITYEPGGLNLAKPWRKAVRRVEDSIGLVAENTFDAEGRLQTNRNGADELEAYTYGFAVFPDSFTGKDGISAAFPIYGVHGHWLEAEGPLANARSFDPIGNPQVSSVNGRSGGLVFREFDANRRPRTWHVSSTDDGVVSGAGAVVISRRSDGQPLYVSRPGGGDHRFEYDALGRLSRRSERVDGKWHDTIFEYDAGGNLTATELPNGMRQEFDYDVCGRLVHHRAIRAGHLEGERVLTYRAGKLATSWDSVRGTTETYSYDAAARATAVSFGNGDVLVRGFDRRSRLTSETWSVGTLLLADIGYAFDLANRLILIEDRSTAEALVEVDYDRGRPNEVRYANGLTRAIFYDPTSGKVAGAETRNAAGALVEATSITHSSEPGPARSQLHVAVQTPLAATEEEYWLTLSRQLTDPGSRIFHWENEAGASRGFSYDLLGNRTSAGADLFTYNTEGNRLETAALGGATVTYTYDEAGFAISRGGVPITWSSTGRMTSFGTDRAVWDMSGRLVELEVAGTVRHFDLFGGAVESDLETESVGSLDLGHVVVDVPTGRFEFRHFDFRNNVSFVSDENGDVTAHYRYRPYGLDEVFGVDDGVHFVGKLAMGPLMLLGARVYDPQVGRFISPDPILQPLNQYTYTNGNPISFTDATGLVEARVVVAVFGLIAAVAAAVAILPAASVIAIGGVTLAQIAAVTAVSAGIAAAVSAVGEIVTDGLGSIGGTGGSGGGGGDGDGKDSGPGNRGGGGTLGPSQMKVLEFSFAPPPPSPQSCSPTQLAEAPGSHGWLPWVLSANLILGLVVLRMRRKGGSDGKRAPMAPR